MSNSNGIINNTESRPSTEIRELIQNKNLLQNKGDLYSNVQGGVIHRGEEGKLLGYDKIYEPASRVSNGTFSRASARESLNTVYEPLFFDDTHKIIRGSYKNFYPCDFLSFIHNESAVYQFTVTFNISGSLYTSTNTAPITFFKKQVFNNRYYPLSPELGVNKEHSVFHEHEQYYIYNPSSKTMESIALNANTFSSAFGQYGNVYTKKIHTVFCYLPFSNYVIKIKLDEEGVYGVFKMVLTGRNIEWEEMTNWSYISYMIIQ